MRASGMNSKLSSIRPATYQLVPLSKILINGFKSILIADGVGVGKTISALYIALYTGALTGKPTLVVCSPGLIQKWMEELRTKFSRNSFPVRAHEDLLTAKEEASYPRSSAPIYVMSNSVMTEKTIRDCPELASIIFDEIHTYRNPETNWFKAALGFARKAEFRVGLSATPINNSIQDLAAELNILFPDRAWDSVETLVEDLWANNRESLTFPLVTRYTKDKLGIHFAKRNVRSRIVSYPQGYVRQVKSLLSTIGLGRGSLYELMTYYRMAASSPYCLERALKLKHKFDAEDSKVEALRKILRSQHKISQWLVFCEFEETVNFLLQNLNDWITFGMTGSTPIFERGEMIKTFRSTPNSVLVMTSVGSEGLDLQFCQGLINYDMHWNPMKIEQRIGRIDRVGQEKDEVFITNIIISGSIDERILRVINRKLGLIIDSVFATGEIIGPLPEHERSLSLFDQEVLDLEINESQQLLSAVKLNSGLAERDYDILKGIDGKYCFPDELASAAKNNSGELVWIKGTDLDSWKHELESKASEVKRLLRYYT